jgi:hypothetical protein
MKYADEAYLKSNEPFSTLTFLIYRRYSFQKISDLSQGNNVLDSPASITDAFLEKLRVFLQLS